MFSVLRNQEVFGKHSCSASSHGTRETPFESNAANAKQRAFVRKIAALSEQSQIRTPTFAMNRTAAPRPAASFASQKPNFPPGALVPGQRPDRALNSAQFAAATQARAAGVAAGLTGRALEVSVAQAAMNAK